MRRNLRIRIALFGIGLGPLVAQGPTLTGTGYSDPAVIKVAPGQITTLYVTGLTTVLSNPINATAAPLPVTLAGISVTLKQTGIQPTPVPLLSVQQVVVCSNELEQPSSPLTADCLITAITVQVPFGLLLPPFTPDVFAELIVTEKGNVSKAFRVLPVKDNLHVINVCDTFPAIPKGTVPGIGCPSVVTHANGHLITADDPAQPGEEVVIWAFGLGPTTPTPRTGEVSPAPAPTLSSFLYLQFDFRTNATPSRPYVNPLIVAPIPTPAPIFAGLTPGQIGLYQINVRVPTSIPAVPSCTTGTPGNFSLYNTVQSNLTIDIGATMSFDGATICVNAGVQPLSALQGFDAF